MSRALVFPWHGKVSNNQVTLANGTTRPYISPGNANAASYGPGDTHRIIVPGIAPITDVEAAQAPAGGEYWAGQALITANILYGQQLDGWIYQAPDGTRWWCRLVSSSVSAASSRIQLIIRRFGDFGVAPETYYFDQTLPIGYPDAEIRRLLFGSLGVARNVGLRLHSVSDTGAHAVIALTLFNGDNISNPNVDTRHRAYAFIQLTLTKPEEGVIGVAEVLYGPSDIVSLSQDVVAVRRLRMPLLYATVEIGREPIIDDGAVIGYTVSYEWPPDVSLTDDETGSFEGPSSTVTVRRWLVMVAFDDETPRPIYLDFSGNTQMGRLSFICETESPFVQAELNTGENSIVDDGSYRLVGGVGFSGSATVRIGDWSASMSGTKLWTTQGYDLTTVATFDGQSYTNVSESPFLYTTPGFGHFDSDVAAYTPEMSAGVDMFLVAYEFYLYSNNQVGIAKSTNGEDYTFLGSASPDGFVAAGGAVPATTQHFGSYNPVTGEAIVGSPIPVNWT
jgi:hypothetical protein